MNTADLDKIENINKRLDLYIQTYRLTNKLADLDFLNHLKSHIEDCIKELQIAWDEINPIPF